MEIIERPGEGRLAIATRSFRTGELVHASRPLVCLPTPGRLRCGNICIGCLSHIISSGSSPLLPRKPATLDVCPHQQSASLLPSSESIHTPQQQQRDAPTTKTTEPVTCPDCCGSFCSQSCFLRNHPAHVSSGECAVVFAFLSPDVKIAPRESDDELLIVCALIARAIAEGHNVPLEHDHQHHHHRHHAEGPLHQLRPCEFESLTDEINFVHAQPRMSLRVLFPGMFRSDSGGAEQNDGGNEKHVEEPPLNGAAAVTTSVSPIPPPPPPRASSSSPSFLADKQAQQHHHPQTGIMLAAKYDDAGGVQHLLEIDRQQRIQAVHGAQAPTFLDFADLVSNASCLRRDQLQQVEVLRSRYRSLAQKVQQQQQKVQQQRASTTAVAYADGSTSSSFSSSSFFVSSPIHPAFFAHLHSAFACNYFGAWDSKKSATDPRRISSAVFCDASYFNHACEPWNNLFHRSEGRNECFYAATDIPEGSPLMIDYGAALTESVRGMRRELLLKNYRFWCGCVACATGASQHTPQSIGSDPVVVSHGNNDDDEDSSIALAARNSPSCITARSRPCCSFCIVAGDLRPILLPSLLDDDDDDISLTAADENENKDDTRIAGYECRICHRFVAAC